MGKVGNGLPRKGLRRGALLVRHFALAILSGLLVSGCANVASQYRPTGDLELARLVNDRIPGKPVHCISTHQIRSSRVIDRKAIIYEVSRHLFYVNEPQWGAEALWEDSILLSRRSLPTLCAGEVISLLDSSFNERGAISLSEFVPYRSVATNQQPSRIVPDQVRHPSEPQP